MWKIKGAHLIPVSASHMERRVQGWGALNTFNQPTRGYFKIRVWLAWLRIGWLRVFRSEVSAWCDHFLLFSSIHVKKETLFCLNEQASISPFFFRAWGGLFYIRGHCCTMPGLTALCHRPSHVSFPPKHHFSVFNRQKMDWSQSAGYFWPLSCIWGGSHLYSASDLSSICPVISNLAGCHHWVKVTELRHGVE